MSLPADEDRHLEDLQARFLAALDARRAHDVDAAAELLRGILRVEPRLAEPRIELAGILLGTGVLDEAEEQAREAVRILESGGQWTDDLAENTVLSLAWGTLGEILRQQADSDEVVFGDPDRWRALMDEARAAFASAARLDPTNAHALGWAGGLGPPPEPEDEPVELDN